MKSLHAGISEISIKNFRGIEDLSLSFLGPQQYPTQVVVLGGPNGSGKTSVLEACLLAVGYRGELQGKTGTEAVRHGADDYQLAVKARIQQQEYSYSYGSGDRGRDILPCVYFSSWRKPGLVGSIGITAGKKGRRPDKTEDNRLWRIKQYLINAKAHELFPSSSPDRAQHSTPYESAMNDLNRAWEMFYSGHRFNVETISDDPDAGFDLFIYFENDLRLSVDLLSAGQLELLTLVGGLIVEKFPQGLIVIDEPELHLDPQWHRQLLRVIQFLKPECQVLVATHSPSVYDSARSFERHFLVPDSDPRALAWNLRKANAEID